MELSGSDSSFRLSLDPNHSPVPELVPKLSFSSVLTSDFGHRLSPDSSYSGSDPGNRLSPDLTTGPSPDPGHRQNWVLG